MRESSTFQAILEEGIEMGVERGSIDTLQETLLRFGIRRSGEPSALVEAKINTTRNLPTLKAWEERFYAVETWDELLAE